MGERSARKIAARALTVAASLGVALALALPAAGVAHGRRSLGAQRAHRTSSRTYFWSNLAEPIRAPGMRPQREVLRPSTIIMFADGSWAIEHLRWKGWGSKVAHARGTSVASNGIPNLAEGKLIKRPARIALSDPRRFHGRRVYGCFTLRVGHRTRQHLCLSHRGGYWLLLGSKP